MLLYRVFMLATAALSALTGLYYVGTEVIHRSRVRALAWLVCVLMVAVALHSLAVCSRMNL